MTRTIGIDPGLAGGLGVLDLDGDGHQRARLEATPVVQVTGRGGRRVYDVGAMAQLLRELVADDVQATVMLERQGARPAQGVASSYQTGLGMGIWLGLLGSLAVPYELVMPAVWKRWHGLIGMDKRASRLRAQERFPELGVLPAKAEGPAEGLLLAVYGAARRPAP